MKLFKTNRKQAGGGINLKRLSLWNVLIILRDTSEEQEERKLTEKII